MLTDFSNEFFCRSIRKTPPKEKCVSREKKKCGPKLKNTIEIYEKSRDRARERTQIEIWIYDESSRHVCVYVFYLSISVSFAYYVFFFYFSFGLVSSFPFGRNSCVFLVYTVYTLRQRITNKEVRASSNSSRATTTTTMKWTKNIYERNKIYI